MPESDWMAQLSGPLAQRATLLATLDRAGVNVDHDHTPRGFDTDPTEGWITARHHDIGEIAARAAESGWQLRAHWPTPTCLACQGLSPANGVPCVNCGSTGRTERRPAPSDYSSVIADLHARLARLENQGA